MDNRVARCPPAGATPLLRFGLPSPPGVVGMVMAPGSASGKHPFYVVCKCGLGCCVCGACATCWRWGVGFWALGGAPRACLVCGRRWLCVGEVPVWWVWPPPRVLGVWLVLVLAAGGVAVRRCCCGTLLCFALLYVCAAACCRVLASFIVCLCRLWRAVLRYVLCCLRIVRYSASVRRDGRGYPGRAAPPVGAEFG